MLILKSKIFNQIDPLIKKHFSNWTLFDVVCDDFYGQGSIVLQNKVDSKKMFCLGALFEVKKIDNENVVTKLVSFYMSQDEMETTIKKFDALPTPKKSNRTESK
jgi:hypothetical protein